MGKSSKDKRDIFYRLAKEQGWRARSAFKLLHINEEFNIFKNVKYAVDLCGAPGSWSQVLCKYIKTDENPNSKIVSIDLQAMAPIPNVIQIRGDITDKNTAYQIASHFEGNKADLVVCDGAPDVTGLHDFDEYLQSQLVVAALNISTHVLKEGGVFLAKIFRGKDTDILCSQLGILFQDVCVVKPKSSRHSSVESFVLCRNYSPPADFIPSMDNPLIHPNGWEFDKLEGSNRFLFPFVTCGDLSGFDSDTSYHLRNNQNQMTYEHLSVVQSPIEPAYAHSCELKKKGLLPKKLE